MRRLREQFPNELVVIGVHSAKFPSEQLTENIRQAVQRLGIEHPVINDAGFKVWNSYAVRAWPTLVLIDPRGRIAGEISGEILADELAMTIQDVIEQNAEVVDRSPLASGGPAPVEPERPLRYPARVLLAGQGDAVTLFIADTGHHRIVQVRLDEDGLAGEVERVFGEGQPALKDGPAAQAAFHGPHGLGLKGSLERGTLYVADTENHALRAIDLAAQTVRTVAGSGQKGHGRQVLGGDATTIGLRSPWAVLPLDHFVLVAMAGSHQIWVLIDEQQIGPFAGTGQEALVDGTVTEACFNQPSDLAMGMGHLFVADAEASAIRAINLGEQAQVMTLVGQGLFAFGDQDGATNQALLQHPSGVDYDGRLLYVADTYNNKLKVLDPFAGQVQSLIGDGQPGRQDGEFEQARLYEPEGVQVHGGRIYIADTNNHAIRVADLQTRQVHTLRLRGLERLPGAPAGVDDAPAQRLDELEIGQGRVTLQIEPQLPEGCAFNPDAHASLRVNGSDIALQQAFTVDEPMRCSFELAASQDLQLDVTVYYCREKDHSLCLIDSRRLILPVRVHSGGPAQALIRYRLPGL